MIGPSIGPSLSVSSVEEEITEDSSVSDEMDSLDETSDSSEEA